MGKIILQATIILLITSFTYSNNEGYSLTVEAIDLRNSKGEVQYTLYNTRDAFPDEHYKKYYRKLNGKIKNGKSSVIFKELPPGEYAVNILHDEDKNGKVKKGLVLPKEGIGFSNYESIGMFNKPNFSEASFDLKSDKSIKVKVIYM